jgi:hypothetical protein
LVKLRKILNAGGLLDFRYDIRLQNIVKERLTRKMLPNKDLANHFDRLVVLKLSRVLDSGILCGAVAHLAIVS